MFRTFFIGATLSALSISAFAQENLVGKWSGSYLYVGNLGGAAAPVNIGVELEITSLENNVVKGLAKLLARVCGGEYPLTGKLADLIVVAANPLEDINNVRRLLLVLKEGRVVSDKRR